MLRESNVNDAPAALGTAEASLDSGDYFKLSAQLKRLLERVALPRRWSRDEVREVQKALKDVTRELERQYGLCRAGDARAGALRHARAALAMSASSVPTPAWYLCLLAACESLTLESARHAS